MELRLIQNYKENDEYRRSFNELAGQVFGIDFEKWYRLGFWNERYICHSFLDRDKVVANVSANLIELVVDGKNVPAVQIGTVMTHPDYRRMGLADRLMTVVLEEYRDRCESIFLFANPEAEGFYQRYDFSTAKETGYYAELPEVTDVVEKMGKGARKLDPSREDDLKILRRLAAARVPLSGMFDAARTEGILAWHCLNVFPKDIWYIDELDTIVICRVEGTVLQLYDIVCTRKPDYRKVVEALDTRGATEAVFHFTPDFGPSGLNGFNIKSRPFQTEDYIFFVSPSSVLFQGEFHYPYTAHA